MTYPTAVNSTPNIAPASAFFSSPSNEISLSLMISMAALRLVNSIERSARKLRH